MANVFLLCIQPCATLAMSPQYNQAAQQKTPDRTLLSSDFIPQHNAEQVI